MGFHVRLGECRSLSSTGSVLNLRVFMMHVPVETASEPPRGFADFGQLFTDSQDREPEPKGHSRPKPETHIPQTLRNCNPQACGFKKSSLR